MNRRSINSIKGDLRNWAGLLTTARLIGEVDTIEYCTREMIAMENELTFRRTGTTDAMLVFAKS